MTFISYAFFLLLLTEKKMSSLPDKGMTSLIYNFQSDEVNPLEVHKHWCFSLFYSLFTQILGH